MKDSSMNGSRFGGGGGGGGEHLKWGRRWYPGSWNELCYRYELLQVLCYPFTGHSDVQRTAQWPIILSL